MMIKAFIFSAVSLVLVQPVFSSGITITADLNAEHSSRIKQNTSTVGCEELDPGHFRQTPPCQQDTFNYDYNTHSISFMLTRPNPTLKAEEYKFSTRYVPYLTGNFHTENVYEHRFSVTIPQGAKSGDTFKATLESITFDCLKDSFMSGSSRDRTVIEKYKRKEQ
jgi:hypothetical protein